MTDTPRTDDQETPTEETQETVGNETEETQGPETGRNVGEGLSAENGEKSDAVEYVPNSENVPTDDPDVFPREYVEKLRDENAENRVKAKRVDELAYRLHTALVEASGRLQDASDLPFDEAHLDDPETLTTAIDSLLEAKPHLASRRVSGDIGQGTIGNPENTVNLAGMLRGNL